MSININSGEDFLQQREQEWLYSLPTEDFDYKAAFEDYCKKHYPLLPHEWLALIIQLGGLVDSRDASPISNPSS